MDLFSDQIGIWRAHGLTGAARCLQFAALTGKPVRRFCMAELVSADSGTSKRLVSVIVVYLCLLGCWSEYRQHYESLEMGVPWS